jgi:hypothetical protein
MALAGRTQETMNEPKTIVEFLKSDYCKQDLHCEARTMHWNEIQKMWEIFKRKGNSFYGTHIISTGDESLAIQTLIKG